MCCTANPSLDKQAWCFFYERSLWTKAMMSLAAFSKTAWDKKGTRFTLVWSPRNSSTGGMFPRILAQTAGRSTTKNINGYEGQQLERHCICEMTICAKYIHPIQQARVKREQKGRSLHQVWDFTPSTYCFSNVESNLYGWWFRNPASTSYGL